MGSRLGAADHDRNTRPAMYEYESSIIARLYPKYLYMM
jgi:hypothetical protein